MTETQTPPEPQQQAVEEPTPEPQYGAEDVAATLSESGQRALASAYFQSYTRDTGNLGLNKADADSMVNAIKTNQPWTPPSPLPPVVISDVQAAPDAGDPTLCTVTWTTDAVSDSQVHYGLTPTYGFDTTLDTAQVTNHTVDLTGLTAATTYHYSVASNGVTSPDATFDTGA